MLTLHVVLSGALAGTGGRIRDVQGYSFMGFTRLIPRGYCRNQRRSEMYIVWGYVLILNMLYLQELPHSRGLRQEPEVGSEMYNVQGEGLM